MNMKELEKKIKEFEGTKEFGELKTLTWSRSLWSGQRVRVFFEEGRGKRVYRVHDIPEEVSVSCLWEKLEKWMKDEKGYGVKKVAYLELEEIYGEGAQLRKDFPKDSLVEICTDVDMNIGYGIVEGYKDGQVGVRVLWEGRPCFEHFFRENLTLIDPDDFDPKWECVSPIFKPGNEGELESLRTRAGMRVFRILLDAAEHKRELSTPEEKKLCRLCAFLCTKKHKRHSWKAGFCTGLSCAAMGFTRGVRGGIVDSDTAYQYFLGYKASTDSLSRQYYALVRALIHNDLVANWLFS